MHRFLAIGYLLTALAFAANLLVYRLPAASPDAINRMLLGQATLLALLPAAIFLIIGARQSVGRARKLLGYSLAAFDLLGAASGVLALVMILSGQAQLSAA